MNIELPLGTYGDVEGELKKKFQNAHPFPYIVIDNFLNAQDAEKLLAEHIAQGDASSWGAYNHVNERKNGITKYEKMGLHTRAVIDALSSEKFLNWLVKLTGIEYLIHDPELDGGGLHMIERGGYLNVHVDFLAHTTNKSWSRQINFLLYLNKDWQPEWNGALELWERDMSSVAKKIEPIFNRCVIFNTCEGSYHGHPTPLNCPETVQRRSMALYYFRDEGKKQSLKPTHYVPTPNDTALKKAMIVADRKALGVYSFLKRYLGIKDDFIQKILRKF